MVMDMEIGQLCAALPQKAKEKDYGWHKFLT